MFAPFFTTKIIGRGLGLSSVGIVRIRHDVVVVSSDPGVGELECNRSFARYEAEPRNERKPSLMH